MSRLRRHLRLRRRRYAVRARLGLEGYAIGSPRHMVASLLRPFWWRVRSVLVAAIGMWLVLSVWFVYLHASPEQAFGAAAVVTTAAWILLAWVSFLRTRRPGVPPDNGSGGDGGPRNDPAGNPGGPPPHPPAAAAVRLGHRTETP